MPPSSPKEADVIPLDSASSSSSSSSSSGSSSGSSSSRTSTGGVEGPRRSTTTSSTGAADGCLRGSHVADEDEQQSSPTGSTTTTGSSSRGGGGGSSSYTGSKSSRSRAGPVHEIQDEASGKVQLKALLAKSATFQLRQKKTNTCQLCTAVFIVVAMFLLQQLVDSFVQSDEGATLPAILNQPILPPALVRTDTSISSCRSFPQGPQAVVCNYSSPDPCPAQPAGVLYGDFWVTKPDGVADSAVDFAALGSWNGRAVGTTNTVFGNVANKPITTFYGKIWPDRGNTQEFCDNDPYYTYPFNFTRVPSKEGQQAKLYNNFKSSNEFGGYVFRAFSLATKVIDYSIHHNASLTLGDDVPVFMSMFTNALVEIIAPAANTRLTFEGTKDMPTVERDNSFDLISLLGPILYIYVFQLMLPVILSSIVFEKENKLRQIMAMMGLKAAPYWIVNYVFGFTLYMFFAFFFWALAAIFKFRYWTLNSPGAIFLLLFIWGHVLMSIVLVMQVFFQKTQSASIGGYLFVFAIGLLASQVIRQYLYQPETPRATIVLISLIPPFAFYRGLVILSQGVSFDEPGLQWKDLNNDRVRMGEVYGLLAAEWVVLMILAAYLETVYTSEYGIKRKPLFFLDAAFWKGLFGQDDGHVQEGYASTVIAGQSKGEPEDVAAERARVRGGEFYDLRCADMTKTYPGSGGIPDKEACKQMTLGVEVGECFGLLGPSGSGKTTAISVISGLFPPTSGTAHVCGFDVRSDIDLAHLNMGVCNQEDLLWDCLTGPEHLRFYGRLKGLSGSELAQTIHDVLDSVGLDDPATRAKKSSEYSGGMKRRLSVACALIGSPRIVLLDEPSTGLDPYSRMCLYNVINEYKSRCALILTTHSMVEAETLCDRIGIIVDGQLKAIGSPPDLIMRYGRGYKLTVTCAPDQIDALDRFVTRNVPSARRLNALSGTSNFEIDKNAVALHDLFAIINGAPDVLAIVDWGISDSSLEEVFLKVCDGNYTSVAESDTESDTESSSSQSDSPPDSPSGASEEYSYTS